MKNIHRQLAVYIAGFVIGGMFAAIWKRWKESTVIARIGFAAALGGAIGLMIALYFRAQE